MKEDHRRLYRQLLQLRKESLKKNSGLYGIRILDLCDTALFRTGALHQYHRGQGFESHLYPGSHVAAKIAIFRVLRKIASLTIFRVSCDFSQFFVLFIITKPDRVARPSCENC